uniref:Uncharacterized protein n=1 Tax=Avena sativa TaxID=4498 RepID=A0ACD5XV56_AVESA
MLSSTSNAHSLWPQYGPVPMTKCHDCPRTASLKRLVTLTDQNDNLGHKFVKCESKPELGKDLRKCKHFEWLDQYVEWIGSEGASLGPNLSGTQFIVGSGAINKQLKKLARTVGNEAGVKGAAQLKELKQINKQLKKLVDLKK